MKIKLVPQFEKDPPSSQEELEFIKVQQAIAKLGYTTLLLSYTDGTVLMRSMTPEETKACTRT